jgi:hypothetical protein
LTPLQTPGTDQQQKTWLLENWSVRSIFRKCSLQEASSLAKSGFERELGALSYFKTKSLNLFSRSAVVSEGEEPSCRAIIPDE